MNGHSLVGFIRGGSMRADCRRKGMDICWSTVLFNVREASQELAGLVRDIESVEGGRKSERNLNEGRLAVSLAHAYHHLNTAWRARGREMPRADLTFEANEKWPQGRAFDRYWPKRLLERVSR